MRSFILLLRKARFFLVPLGIFLLLSGTFLLLYKKEVIHLYINQFHSSFGDKLMPFVTLLGDGWTITIFCLLVFAYDRRFGFYTGIACLGASGITQALKHTIFYGEGRPAWVFRDNHNLRFVPGVEMNYFDTFPSGHTTVSFAFFFCLAFLVKNNWLRFACFFIALIIGYSRIYLSQHFLNDVFGGSIVGTLTSLLVLTLVVHFGGMKKSPLAPIEY